MWVTISLRKKELKQEHTNYQLRDLQISREKRQLDRRKRYEQSLIQLQQKQAINPLKTAYDEKVAALNKEKTALSQYLLAVKKVQDNTLDNYKIDGNDKNKVYIKADGGNYVCESSGGGFAFYNTKNGEAALGTDGLYYDENQIPLSLESNSDGGVQKYQLAFDLSQYEAELSKYQLSTDLSQITSDTDISSLEATVNGLQSQIQLELQTSQTSYMGEVDAEKTIWENELELLEDEVGEEETELELEQTDVETQMEYISNELQAIGDAVSNGIQQNVIKLS